MGNLSTKIHEFREDFGNSWWFRFWVVAWVISFIFAFTALILFGARSSEDQSEKGWRMWISEHDSIAFPSFQFRTDLDELTSTIASAQCLWKDGELAKQIKCTTDDPNTSVEFFPEGFAGSKTWNSLRCYVNVSAPANADSYLAFGVTAGRTLDRTDAFHYILPTRGAFVSLRLSRAKAHDKTVDFWGVQLSYRNSIKPTTFTYDVILQIDSFHVFNYEETTWYTGWMSAADIGGFAFFMYIIHWIFTTFLGIFMERHSKFLGIGTSPAASYNTL